MTFVGSQSSEVLPVSDQSERSVSPKNEKNLAYMNVVTAEMKATEIHCVRESHTV